MKKTIGISGKTHSLLKRVLATIYTRRGVDLQMNEIVEQAIEDKVVALCAEYEVTLPDVEPLYGEVGDEG